MPINQRDIVKIILGVCIALLLGAGKIFSIDIYKGHWLLLISGLLGYVLFSIWKRRI